MALNIHTRAPLMQRDVGAFDELLEGVQILGADWRYLYVNDAAAQHGRRTRDELLGRSMLELYPGIDQTDVFRTMDRCMTERIATSYESHFLYPDGSQAWFELRIQPVPEGIMVMSIDISHRKELEERFQAAQRLDSVGRLAAGVAHDLNNVLTIIATYSTFLLEDLADDSQAFQDVEQIRAAARRCASLLAQLLAFTRHQPITPARVDVNAIIRQLDDQFLKRLLPRSISVQLDLAGSLDEILIDPTQMDQVLMNLIINARDAMSAGGRLCINTRNVRVDDGRTGAPCDLHPGNYVLLTVSDTGYGMTSDIQAHIFEPFFTTKGSNGTGLGLSTVYGIVRQNRGHISLESRPGEGSVFRVFFPRADGSAAMEPNAPRSNPRRKESVLLAEDEPAMREVAARVLRQHGYVVFEASDVEAAARLWSEHEGDFDLVVTDLALPDGSGRDLVARLQGPAPVPPVLYVSAYAEELGVPAISSDRTSLLPKPITPVRLLERVREILAQDA